MAADPVSIAIGSLEGTGRFAGELAAILRGGEMIALCGELGAGKTTLVRALTAALGSTDPVASPTFVLEHEYRATGRVLRHWDLYRLGDEPEELREPPLACEVRLIEWADRFPDLLNRCDLVITIRCGSGEQRVVTVSGPAAGDVPAGRDFP